MTADMGLATIRLKLEDGTQSIIEAYERVLSDWYLNQYQVDEADRNHDHAQAAETLKKMGAEVQAIIATAKADLDVLGEPI